MDDRRIGAVDEYVSRQHDLPCEIDVLAREGRDAAGLELRRRLGIPDGVRTVLYAPTYRDQVLDRRNRYRLDLHLDVERLRAAVGDDTVILFR